MSNAGVDSFGLWQGANFVLYLGVDAEWNKVQHWPFFDWFNVESVLFPTVIGVTVAIVFGLAVILLKAFVD